MIAICFRRVGFQLVDVDDSCPFDVGGSSGEISESNRCVIFLCGGVEDLQPMGLCGSTEVGAWLRGRETSESDGVEKA